MDDGVLALKVDKEQHIVGCAVLQLEPENPPHSFRPAVEYI